MKIRKWNLGKLKRKVTGKNRKKGKIMLLHDDLSGAKAPPDWMRALLFDSPDHDADADKIA